MQHAAKADAAACIFRRSTLRSETVPVQGVDDPRNLVVTHQGRHRERQDFMVDALADGIASAIPLAISLLLVGRNGIVYHRLDAFAREILAQVVALGSSYRIDVPDIFIWGGRHLWQRDERVRDAFAISLSYLSACLVICIQTLQ